MATTTSPQKDDSAQLSFPARVRQGFANFFAMETSGAIVMLIATALALIVANTGLYDAFQTFWETESGLFMGTAKFMESNKAWIDDGLMAIFFFVVGLEIKREVVVGELSTFKKAILPIVAALGGMICPAIIYYAINHGGPGAHGWGIPMATDIAFALGILALLSSKIPHSMKVFLSALAVADDIGAIIVIAIFYSGEVLWAWLGWALIPIALMFILGRMKVDKCAPYIVLTVVLWYCFLHSGIHATLAGVIAAFLIPTTNRLSALRFGELAEKIGAKMKRIYHPERHVLESDAEHELALELKVEGRKVASPLQRLEHAILPVSNFIVLPLFALANAEIRIVGGGGFHLGQVGLGVFLGLVVGKPLGVFGMTWICSKLKIVEIPKEMNVHFLIGSGLLAGIGFTMSIFVTNIAFSGASAAAEIQEAKVGILMASITAAILGYLWISVFCRKDTANVITEKQYNLAHSSTEED